MLGKMSHAFFQRGHRPAISGGPQPGNVRLGEALILAAQSLRKGDVLDLPPSQQTDHDPRDVVESAAGARADVENSLPGRTERKEEVHVDRIAHEDEIAPLL